MGSHTRTGGELCVMAHMATISSRNGQTPDYLGIGVIVAVGVVTLSLIVGGYGEYGALLIAVSAGVFVLTRSGTFRTKYQKGVANVLKPIDRANVRQAEASGDLDAELETLGTIEPPVEARAVHDAVIATMRSLIDRRRELTICADVVSFWCDALRGLESLSLEASGNTGGEDEHLAGYVAEVNEVIAAFRVKQDEIAALHYEKMANAIGALQGLTPPKSRALAHRELVEGLIRLNDLSMEQHRCIYDGDLANTEIITGELKGTREVIHNAIRQVMWWH